MLRIFVQSFLTKGMKSITVPDDTTFAEFIDQWTIKLDEKLLYCSIGSKSLSVAKHGSERITNLGFKDKWKWVASLRNIGGSEYDDFG